MGCSHGGCTLDKVEFYMIYSQIAQLHLTYIISFPFHQTYPSRVFLLRHHISIARRTPAIAPYIFWNKKRQISIRSISFSTSFPHHSRSSFAPRRTNDIIKNTAPAPKKVTTVEHCLHERWGIIIGSFA